MVRCRVSSGSLIGLVATAAAVGAILTASATAAPAAVQADPWVKAAAKLSMPVYRPAVTLGLRVAYVNPIFADPGCVNDGREQLRAIYYGPKAGRYIEVLEGHPRYCSDRALDAPVTRRLKIGGRPAKLYDLCGLRDCDGLMGAYSLDWCVRGTTISVVGLDFRPPDLVRLARSMRPVDRAPALRCPSA